jgi:branched-chain amino acid transport system permease protein
MAFLGGFGTLLGPLLGGLILEASQQYLVLSFSNGSLYLILFGVLFLLVILFMPQGIVGGVSQWWALRALKREMVSMTDPEAVGANP